MYSAASSDLLCLVSSVCERVIYLVIGFVVSTVRNVCVRHIYNTSKYIRLTFQISPLSRSFTQAPGPEHSLVIISLIFHASPITEEPSYFIIMNSFCRFPRMLLIGSVSVSPSFRHPSAGPQMTWSRALKKHFITDGLTKEEAHRTVQIRGKLPEVVV